MRGLLMIIVSAALYGTMPMFTKFAYAQGVNTETVLFFRYFLACLMFVPIFFTKKLEKFKLNFTQLALILIASVATVLTTYALFVSYSYISSGLATTLHFVYPLATTILAIFFYKERMNLKKYGALFFSFIGIALLSYSDCNANSFVGLLWALSSGIFYAIYIICLAHKSIHKIDSLVEVFYVLFFSSIMLFFWGIGSHKLTLDISASALFYLGNLSFWTSFLAVLLFLVGMKFTGPSNAAILSTFEPITGIGIGVWLFHEEISPLIAFSILLILVSVMLIAKAKNETNKLE